MYRTEIHYTINEERKTVELIDHFDNNFESSMIEKIIPMLTDIKDVRGIEVVTIEDEYVSDDRTIIWKHTVGEDFSITKLVGWYCGKPDDESTLYYLGLEFADNNPCEGYCEIGFNEIYNI